MTDQSQENKKIKDRAREISRIVEKDYLERDDFKGACSFLEFAEIATKKNIKVTSAVEYIENLSANEKKIDQKSVSKGRIHRRNKNRGAPYVHS